MSLLGPKYDKKVVRQRSPKADLWDKAAEIEDNETEQKKWKLKSDGQEIPKPEQSKVGYLFYRKWYHKLLFMPKQRIEYAIFEDKGDGNGTFKDPHSESLAGGEDHGIFQTHRTLEAKKYLDLYSEDDNKELYILGALTLIVLTDLIGTYIITNSVDKIAASSIRQAVESGVGAAETASDSDVPGVSMIPVIGFLGRQKIGELKQKWF